MTHESSLRPSRRQVLRTGVIAGVAASAPLALAEQATALVTTPRLSRRMFAPRVGSTFRFTAKGVSYSATLKPLRDLAGSAPGHAYRFRLLFTTRVSGPAQGTYRFTHPTLAAVTLFVVPVGSGRRYYEAVVYS
jgi:hypothetical protein